MINPLLTDTEGVLPEEPRKSLMLNLEERMQSEYAAGIAEGIDYELVVLNGHVSSEILKFLEGQEIDLMVMGSYGLSGAGLVFFWKCGETCDPQDALFGDDRSEPGKEAEKYLITY